MIVDLWNKHGQAVAYVDNDKESIFMRDGTPVAWLWEGGVYTYRGKFLGWLYEGWIFGRDGKCVLFMERSQPGPVKPFRMAAEDRGDQALRPSRESRDSAVRRPGREQLWSSTDALSFFANKTRHRPAALQYARLSLYFKILWQCTVSIVVCSASPGTTFLT